MRVLFQLGQILLKYNSGGAGDSRSTAYSGRRSYYTDGAANYVTTAMEDTGVLQSLTWLARAKKVDRERVLVLRGVSNFDMQPPGVSATDSLAGEKIGQYAAYTQSLENIYRAGSTVVHAIVKDWKRLRDRLP